MTVLRSLKSPFQVFFSFRTILWTAVLSEIKIRNAGSVIGRGWLFLSPLIFVGIYSVVYLMIFKIRPVHMSPQVYVLNVLSGLVPFLALSEGISVGTLSLDTHRSLLKNTVFPIELIPVKVVLATIPTQLFGFLILLIGALSLDTASAYLLLVPAVFLLQLMFTVGVIWIASIVNLVFKDVKNIISYFVMVAMILSPIAYTLDMVPQNLRFMVWINPFAHFVITYQSLIVAKKLPPTDILNLMVFSSLFIFVGAYQVFVRLKRVIAHYA